MQFLFTRYENLPPSAAPTLLHAANNKSMKAFILMFLKMNLAPRLVVDSRSINSTAFSFSKSLRHDSLL